MKKALYLLILLFFVMNLAQAQDPVMKPRVDHAVYFDVSPPLRDMMKSAPGQLDASWKDGVVKNYVHQFNNQNQQNRKVAVADPGLQDQNGWLPSDSTIENFEGVANISGAVPPDTHGEVGLNHFFQVINCAYAVYNKSGNRILGPLASSSVWTGMPNNANSGDAIVLYDEQANRWLFSQFSLPNGSSTAPFYQMIAVSQTPDPTGSWYRWEYEFSKMPDYPKFGVWPDGYYMSANLFMGGWVGNGAYSFDRTAMINGDPGAQRISFTLSPGGEGFITLLPSDCDGTFPVMGTPDYFTYVRTGGTQRLGIYEFHSDWVTPASSTFSNNIYLPVNSFSFNGDAGNGIPQKDSDKKLETLSDRLMYRQQYRKFNGYSSMVLNHTVDGTAGKAGVRWYELRNSGTGWSIYQQATYSPADGNSRWLASIAQDTSGTIAMGYSVSSASIYPAIRYTGRLKNDPLNQMTMTEKTIINGGGSQTGSWSGRSRWGDYSGISVDPASPTTFWFTSEYYGITSSSNWQTRIASFTFANVFSSAASSYPSMICSTSPDSSQLNAYGYGGSGNYTYSWTSVPAGFTSTLKSPKVRPSITTQYIAAVHDGSLVKHDTTSVLIGSAPVASAGGDTTVCWFVSPVPLHGTATNYSKVAWGTGGDGHFSDPNALSTSYYPGIHDKTNGSVSLIMLVVPNAPCLGNISCVKKITLDPCTGIAENHGDDPGIVVMPNPATDKVTITIASPPSTGTLTLTGMDGRILHSETVTSPGRKSKSLQIDVSSFPKGLYLLKLQADKEVLTARVVVD
ncbi:MAG: T9SS type A sorting domain-containing protein [Bacteroidota bacterium]